MKFSPKNYWRSVKRSKKSIAKSCISEISTSTIDPRPHAIVKIGDRTFSGLLDSGASVSCFGRNAITIINNLGLKMKQINSKIKTADGANQEVVGYVDVIVTFSNKNLSVRFYIVPSLTHELYLGIDFWSTFGIVPVINELNLTAGQMDSNCHKLSAENVSG